MITEKRQTEIDEFMKKNPLDEMEELGFWNMKCVELSTREKIMQFQNNYLGGEQNE